MGEVYREHCYWVDSDGIVWKDAEPGGKLEVPPPGVTTHMLSDAVESLASKLARAEAELAGEEIIDE